MVGSKKLCEKIGDLQYPIQRILGKFIQNKFEPKEKQKCQYEDWNVKFFGFGKNRLPVR